MNDYRDEIWTMKDGTEIAIRNMTKQHIASCKAMLKRGKFYDMGIYDDWIEIFDNELEYRKTKLRQKKLESL